MSIDATLTQPQIGEILELQSSGLPAKSGIRCIVEQTTHKGTASYGLRVLSKLGASEEELIELAKAYNGRVMSLTSDLFSPIAPPIIKSFTVEREPDKFETVYLKS